MAYSTTSKWPCCIGYVPVRSICIFFAFAVWNCTLNPPGSRHNYTDCCPRGNVDKSVWVTPTGRQVLTSSAGLATVHIGAKMIKSRLKDIRNTPHTAPFATMYTTYGQYQPPWYTTYSNNTYYSTQTQTRITLHTFLIPWDSTKPPRLVFNQQATQLALTTIDDAFAVHWPRERGWELIIYLGVMLSWGSELWA